MSLSTANVRVGVTGAVYVAPTTVALPANASAALTGYANVGYISQEGVRQMSTVDRNEIVAWQNADVVREPITRTKTQFGLTMIEFNAASLSLYFGEIIKSGDTTFDFGRYAPERYRMVIDVVDGAQTIRHVVPDAEVAERGEIVYANAEPVGFNITVTAFPHPALGGNAVRTHLGQAVGGTTVWS